jgi:DNA (cytosine-5)-methyltransferase 1
MKFRYLSVCSGIEAASVAWEPLGWEAAAFSEIEKFPRQLLQHHYPDVTLHGDFTTIVGDEYGAIDILVGGTPCQAFSVAGLRKGFADERGNLTLEFVRLAQRTNPKWILWENVPGVLSLDRGRAFGSFLRGLAECGYGFAYRVLDAQYFGVPQRRRRVFVVGYLGDWRPAAAVLFEHEGLCGDITPSRETGKIVAETFTARAKSGGWSQNVDLAAGNYMLPVPKIAGTIGARTGRSIGAQDAACGHMIPSVNDRIFPTLDCAMDKKFGSNQWVDSEQFVYGALPIHDKATRHKGGGSDRNNDGCGNGLGVGDFGDPMPTLDTAARHSVAYPLDLRNASRDPEKHDSQNRQGSGIGDAGDPSPTLSTINVPDVASGMAVRRLTPIECERLQGFPDNYTLITPKTADGPRYKALGNSMAVPVMRWLGDRIAKIDSLMGIS